MKIVIILMLLVLLVLLGIFLYTWYRLYKSMHLHVSANKTYVTKYPISYEERSFTTVDGIRIAAWYIPVKKPKAVVILVHGYATALGGKSLMLPHAQYLSAAGYSTLLVDLRGFGQSEGDKITLGVTEWKDLSAAYDYVKSLPENKNVKVGFLGQSMGATSVLNEVGLTGKGDFIIASVPFASLKSLFAFRIHQEGFWPAPLFLSIIRLAAFLELGYNYEHYTPASQIQNIHVPILFIQSTHDQEIDQHDVKYLFDHAHQPKELWVLDSPHDIYENNPDAFKNKVLGFLREM